jgi:hypothetical protein
MSLPSVHHRYGRDAAVAMLFYSSMNLCAFYCQYTRRHRDVDVAVNDDEVVTEDGASRWPRWRCSVEHAGKARKKMMPSHCLLPEAVSG